MYVLAAVTVDYFTVLKFCFIAFLCSHGAGGGGGGLLDFHHTGVYTK